MLRHPPSKELEYSYITDGIYIGTSLCCQVNFSPILRDKEKIATDISLEEEHLDSPDGVEQFVWIPVKNYHAPTIKQLKFGVAVLHELVNLKEKVFVHCQNGHGRAPTLVAAYLISKGMGVDEAINFVKKHRPSIHLEDVQKKALEEFAVI